MPNASKLQNSSTKVSRNSRKTFAEEKNKTCLGFGVSLQGRPLDKFERDKSREMNVKLNYMDGQV